MQILSIKFITSEINNNIPDKSVITIKDSNGLTTITSPNIIVIIEITTRNIHPLFFIPLKFIDNCNLIKLLIIIQAPIIIGKKLIKLFL